MRVAHSLSSAGIGVALLAAFGFASQSRVSENQSKLKQAQAGQLLSEKITVEPILFTWEDLLKVQAAQPKARMITEQAPPASPDLPLQELELLRAAQGFMPLPSGGVQRALCAGYASEPALSKRFDGQLDGPDGAGFSFIPADVTGSVGPDHVMTMLNNKTKIQDRLGGAVSTVDTSVFWSPLGATPLSPTNSFHRVNYDAVDGRWYATCKNGAAGANSIFFAISATNNPTGLWTYYSFLAGGTADWVTQGYNQTWIAIAAEVGTSKLWAIDKATALAGGPLTTTVFGPGYPAAINGIGGTRWTPSRAFDTSAADIYLVAGSSFIGGNSIANQLMRLTGTGPLPTVAATPGVFTPAATSSAYVTNGFGALPLSQFQKNMQELGEATRNLSAFSIRIAGVVLRNGRVWVVQSMGGPGDVNNSASTSNDISWLELDPALMPTPIIQGGGITVGPGTYSMFPSIAVNCGNDVLIGFSSGDATIYPRACYAMRLGTDPLNFMGTVKELKAGESSYWKNFAAPATTCVYGRWSATTVDPIDDKAFWTCQSYADTRVGPLDNDSRWGSHWGRVGMCGAPSITDDPDGVTVCLGDPASFSVLATPFVAPLAYQWRRNGVDIPGATASTYSIASTVFADAATYDVVVDDGCGSSTSLPAVLSFGGAVVTSQPQNQQVKKGGTATFTVAGTGSGTITYEWRHNGVSIVPLETNATLIIAGVQTSDFGSYDCIVSDACGPTVSATAQLTAKTGDNNKKPGSLDLTIFEQPESAIGCVGSSLTLDITAFGHTGLVWRKNGSPIVPAETSATLVLNPIVPGDAGSYDVVVSGPGGPIVSATAVVTVNDVPTVTLNPSNQSKPIGGTATFTCAGTGDGTLTYQWQKAPLMGGSFVNLPNQEEDTLVISPVVAGDAGRYRCVISNHCGGTATASAKLNISI